MKKAIEMIQTESAPKAVGAYSQAVRDGSTLYCSGQIGLDPNLGKLTSSDTLGQARQVFKNLSAVLKAADVTLTDILKVNIFLIDMNDFPAVNQVYAEWLGEHRPARATVAVSALPLNARIEIDLIAKTD
ncbi:MAG: Rid family detoxifying hydrolase [Mariprofundaceae bacterium]